MLPKREMKVRSVNPEFYYIFSQTIIFYYIFDFSLIFLYFSKQTLESANNPLSSVVKKKPEASSSTSSVFSR